MSTRELIILGTSAQVPTRERNHSGFFLRWDTEGFLFDPGEGTQRQMLFAGLNASAIKKIALTHFHGDHCLGLPGVIQRLNLDQASHEIQLYFPAYGSAFVEALLKASLFHSRLQYQCHPTDQAGVIFDNGKVQLSTAKLEHSCETWGYRVQERDSFTIHMDKLKHLGIQGPDVGLLKNQGYLDTPQYGRIQLEELSALAKGQSFAITLDTRPCENALKLAKGVDLLLCESTYLKEEAADAQAHMHMTAVEAAILAKEANVQQLVLTHFSQRYLDLSPFLQQAKEIFPNTIVARDFDHIPLPKRKRSLG